MIDFESYIRQPIAVDEKMVVLPPRTVEPFRKIEDEGRLDNAVALETELMSKWQSQLVDVGSVMIGHLWNHSLEGLSDEEILSRESIENFRQVNRHLWIGFTLGNMAAQALYVNYSSPESMYRDISSSTAAAFQDKDPMEIEMLLDTIDCNTVAQTEPLRELTSFWLESETDRDDLRRVTTTGAVVSYSLMIYERQLALDLQRDGQWASHKGQRDRTRRLIASLPHRVRELKGLNKI